MRSLRRTLLWWLLLPLVAIVPAAVALQYWLVLQPTREAFDQSLRDAVLSVSSFVKTGQGEGATVDFDMDPQAERALRTDQFDTVYYVVLAPDGRRVAGDPPLEAPPLALKPEEWRFYDAMIDGTEVRVAARGVACGEAACQVRIAETQAKRQQVFHDSLKGTLAGVLAFAAATALAIVLATRQALRPLRRLGEELGTRSFDDLRPVDAAGVPAEVHGVVDAMNRLFGRVQQGSLAQQAFLADAAHQLRTPLAALQNEAELALVEDHPAQVAPLLQRLHSGAERAARLSSQLLALARSDKAAQAALPLEAVDLKALAAEAAAEWVPRALAAGVDLGFELEPAPLQGRSFLLRELLANLLHNAIAHAGDGAHVTLRTRREGDTALLEVEDDGPGIAPEERMAVFERFRRGSGARAAGSGLGLAIVRDIAASHGGSAEALDTASGQGVCMRVRLPGDAA